MLRSLFGNNAPHPPPPTPTPIPTPPPIPLLVQCFVLFAKLRVCLWLCLCLFSGSVRACVFLFLPVCLLVGVIVCLRVYASSLGFNTTLKRRRERQSVPNSATVSRWIVLMLAAQPSTSRLRGRRLQSSSARRARETRADKLVQHAHRSECASPLLYPLTGTRACVCAPHAGSVE